MIESDKSIVAYTSFAIEDPKIWTSLCLLHDTVFIFEPWLVGGREPIIESFYRYHRRLHAIKQFQEGPLRILAEAGVIRVINYDEYFKVFSKFSEEYANAASKKFYTNTNMGVHDASSSGMAYTYAKQFNIPIVSDVSAPSFRIDKNLVKDLSNFISMSAITQLSLPDVEALDPESVLEAREALKDDLTEFKASILKLTWLLNETIADREHFEDLRNKVNFLVQTKINGSLISLENKMRHHEKKKVQRLLVSATKVLFHVAKMFTPGALATRILSGSKSVFEIATEMKDATPPEDQVATFLYQVKRRFHHRR